MTLGLGRLTACEVLEVVQGGLPDVRWRVGIPLGWAWLLTHKDKRQHTEVSGVCVLVFVCGLIWLFSVFTECVSQTKSYMSKSKIHIMYRLVLTQSSQAYIEAVVVNIYSWVIDDYRVDSFNKY